MESQNPVDSEIKCDRIHARSLLVKFFTNFFSRCTSPTNQYMPAPNVNIDAYRANVEMLFAKKSPMIIENHDRDHAAVLISTLFQKANEEVFMLTEKLESEFYDREEVRKEMLAALGRNVTVKIVCQREPESRKLVDDLLAAAPKGKFTFTVAEPNSPESIVPYNFTVVDRKAFRFEPDRNDCKAFASANNRETAEVILESAKDYFKN